MLFMTNKIVQGNAGELRFKEKNNELSQSIRYCELNDDEQTFREVGSQSLMQNLKRDANREILFFIHGFNNQPIENVFPNVRNMQSQLNNAGLDVQVVPLVWPCDSDFGVIKDYWDDQDSAEQSGRFFSRTISKLLAWQEENADDPCLKRMHVLAHSMGNRVLMKGLQHWSKHVGRGEIPFLFKNVFMMAADIPNESLEKGEEGSEITKAAGRVMVYYANDDAAMVASKVSNVKNRVLSRRLGHTGPEQMSRVPDNVYSLNCDAFNNKFDLKGHTYFLRKDSGELSPAFLHVMHMIRTQRFSLEKREFVL